PPCQGPSESARWRRLGIKPFRRESQRPMSQLPQEIVHRHRDIDGLGALPHAGEGLLVRYPRTGDAEADRLARTEFDLQEGLRHGVHERLRVRRSKRAARSASVDASSSWTITPRMCLPSSAWTN